MADISGAFLSGHQIGTQEREHQQAMDENKLHAMILKHQLDALKIEDQLRSRAVAENNAKLMEGQPQADLPQEPNPGATLPAANLSQVLQQQFGGASQAPNFTGGMALPAAQAPNMPQTRVAAQSIPGIDAFNGAPAVPGVSVRPQSREDLSQAAIALKQAEQPGQIVGPESTLVQNGRPVFTNATQKPKDEWQAFQQAYAQQAGAQSWEALPPAQRLEGMKAFAAAKRDPGAQALAAEGAHARISAAQQAAFDRSYQFNSTQLEKIATPLSQKSDKLSQALDNLNQRTPQADALIAPAVLSVMVGGQGSGLRMNEAEISRIVGGRSNWETLKASLNKWQLDPTKALSLTDSQRGQIQTLLTTAQTRLNAKVDALGNARQSLIDAPDVKTHRQVVADAQKQLESIDRGALRKEIPGHPGAFAISTDGGKTWKAE